MSETPTWHHVATRLDQAERDELEAYRVRFGLKSLNAAVRHWLQALAAERKQAVG